MDRSTKRAVIIENQRLFVPFLTRAVAESGAAVVATERHARASRLSRLRPDVVVLDAAASSGPPLAAIRTIRRAVPDATLVVFTAEDALWCAVARGLGADVVLGGEAGSEALKAACATRV